MLTGMPSEVSACVASRPSLQNGTLTTTCSCSSARARPSAIIPAASSETTSAEVGPPTRSQMRLHDVARIAVLLGEQRGVGRRAGEDPPLRDLLDLCDGSGVDEKPHAASRLLQPTVDAERPLGGRGRGGVNSLGRGLGEPGFPRSLRLLPRVPASSAPSTSATGLTSSAVRSCGAARMPSRVRRSSTSATDRACS